MKQFIAPVISGVICAICIWFVLSERRIQPKPEPTSFASQSNETAPPPERKIIIKRLSSGDSPEPADDGGANTNENPPPIKLSSFERQLLSPLQVVENGGLKVMVGGSKLQDRIKILRGPEEFIYNMPDGFIYSSPAVANDGSSAFLLVQAYNPQPTNSLSSRVVLKYSGVIWFQVPKGRSLSETKSKIILKDSDLSAMFDGKRTFITEISRVSKSGDRLLVGIVTEQAASDGAPMRYSHAPYWYDFNKNRLILIDD